MGNASSSSSSSTTSSSSSRLNLPLTTPRDSYTNTSSSTRPPRSSSSFINSTSPTPLISLHDPILNSSTSSPSSSSSRKRAHHRHHHTLHQSNHTSSKFSSIFDPLQIINGGQVAPINHLYHTTHNYDPWIVRDLILGHRLAPFYLGLDEVDELEVHKVALALNQADDLEDSVPLGSMVSSSHNKSLSSTDQKSIFENRVKQWISRVGGAVECPICFLYYPNNINKSHCCDQPICTECFVQIKRNDALHPVECPFCAVPGFAVVYIFPHNITSSILTSPLSPTSTSPPIQLNESCTSHINVPSKAILISPDPQLDHDNHKSLSISCPTASTSNNNDSSINPPTSPVSVMAASLTITATTHTRTSNNSSSTSTTMESSTPLSPTVTTSLNSNDVPTIFNCDTDFTTSTPKKSPIHVKSSSHSPKVVTPDDIRPSYVRNLQQNHQLAILQEHRDAAATRFRKLLFESNSSSSRHPIDSSSSSSSSSSSTSNTPSRLSTLLRGLTQDTDGLTSATSMLTNALNRGLSRQQVEHAYFRGLGAGIEELMIEEAIKASLADEEERQRRLASTESNSSHNNNNNNNNDNTNDHTTASTSHSLSSHTDESTKSCTLNNISGSNQLEEEGVNNSSSSCIVDVNTGSHHTSNHGRVSNVLSPLESNQGGMVTTASAAESTT